MDELQRPRERQMPTSDRRSPARRRQAEHTAGEAKQIAARRRDEASGVAGLVAERASEWTLDGPDWSFLEAQKYFWNPLIATGSAWKLRDGRTCPTRPPS